MSCSDLSHADLATLIHNSGRQFVVAATGGAGAISALVGTPGASRSTLEAIVPYANAALAEWLGSTPEQFCSAATSRAMAMAALIRARRLAPDADPTQLVGIACTASLATDRPKRGAHRVYVSTQTVGATASFSLDLAKDARDRAAEEAIAEELVLRALGAACEVIDDDAAVELTELGGNERVEFDRFEAPAAWGDLLLGTRGRVVIASEPAHEKADAVATPNLPLLFPGSFNPPHSGHQRMAAIAEKRCGAAAAWELSIANVDKPPLDFIAIRDRLTALQREDNARRIVLTSAPTFREKAAIFPGACFIVGADTAVRIGDPRYYGDDDTTRDTAIEQITASGCRFLVFGRQHAGRFQTLGDLELPATLRALCDQVSADEFREDVSSTHLRTRSDG